MEKTLLCFDIPHRCVTDGSVFCLFMSFVGLQCLQVCSETYLSGRFMQSESLFWCRALIMRG